MILQLNPPIEMTTPKGRGNANFLIDYGLESDLYWVVFQDSGEIWTWANKDVRLTNNITAGRNCTQKPDSSRVFGAAKDFLKAVEELSEHELRYQFIDTWPIGPFKGHAIADTPQWYKDLLKLPAGPENLDLRLDHPDNHNLKQTLIYLGLIHVEEKEDS